MTKRRIIAVYGILSGLLLEAVFLTSMAFGLHNNQYGMIVGYLTMLVAVSLVFVGVKRFRDEELGGVIRFLPAWGLGTAIALVAAVFYVIGWEIYLFASDYAYVDTIVAMGEDYAFYATPAYRMAMTFTEIAPVVLLVPLVSAALLRNPRFLPRDQRAA